MKVKILGLVVLILGLAAGFFLVQQRQLFQKKASVTGPLFSLVPSSLTVKPGDPFDLDLWVQNPTATPLSAVDVVITFPQDRLHLTNLETSAKNDTSFKTFVPVLSDNSGNFDLNRVLNTANQTGGRLEFGAVIFDWPSQTVTSPVSINFKLARLTFQANAALASATTAQIVFVFDPNAASTIDSNLVAANPVADVLTQANPVTISIVPALPITPPIGNPTASQTPTPSLSPTPSPASLTVKFKFQGITDGRAATKTVKLLNAETLASYDANGVYLATNNNLPAGSYTVLLKGWAHLQNNCGSVTLNSGETRTVDCTAMPLRAGDIDGNGLVESKDIGYILSAWTGIDTPVTDSNRQDDLDLNGLIQSKDIGYALANWLE
jgi:hypothetical protein